MNIKRAKEEIEHTVKAYLAKDTLGEYAIPSIRQRPILLMGPPGIGKTQIMEQAARECGVALVAYTITHHTRQSAVGLPFIRQRNYGGRDVSVTEYTMSEILSSVYRLMERTGLQEGILFLDEINSMPLNPQGKVLRALETKTIQRLGSTQSKKVDFRLLTASNEDLYHLVEEKKFRADLYYRLAVIPIRLPPLRERREDIIPLAQHFLKLFCRKYAKDKEFSPQTLQLMIQYPWPGNVRELRNFVERAVVMSLGRQVAVPDVSSFLDPAPASPLPERPGEDSASVYSPAVSARYEQMISSGVSLQQYLDQCGRNYVAYALQKYGNSYKAAEALGTSQASIMRRKQKFHL